MTRESCGCVCGNDSCRGRIRFQRKGAYGSSVKNGGPRIGRVDARNHAKAPRLGDLLAGFSMKSKVDLRPLRSADGRRGKVRRISNEKRRLAGRECPRVREVAMQVHLRITPRGDR